MDLKSGLEVFNWSCCVNMRKPSEKCLMLLLFFEALDGFEMRKTRKEIGFENLNGQICLHMLVKQFDFVIVPGGFLVVFWKFDR